MLLVTGAAGFIGSNIVATLNERGRDDVVICDWLGSDGRWQNLRKRMFVDHVFPGDLLASLDRLAPTGILHMGANSSTTAADGDEIMRLNYRFSLDLIDYCGVHGIPFVYASSAATYGDGEQGYVDDGSMQALRMLRPLNLYGWSKHQIDLLVAHRMATGQPLPPKCIGLKFFNVYGPNEHHKGSMMSIVGKNFDVARNGGTVSLFESDRAGIEDGGQRRDFVHVQDVVDVALWFLENGPAHGVFNVGTGVATSFAEFVAALFHAVAHEPQIRYVPMPEQLRARYQYFTQASLSRLRAAGYTAPFRDVMTGVADYTAFLAADDPYR